MKFLRIALIVIPVSLVLSACATEPAEFGGLRTIVFDRPITWFGWATILSVVFYLISRPSKDPLENTPFMREVHAWSRGLATVLVPLYVLGWILAPTQVYTFRVTVDVDVDGERKSGSSVLEVIYTKGWARWFMRPNPDFGTGASLSFRGTAPIIDLGKYGTLIASLGVNSAKPLYTIAYDGQGTFDLGPRGIGTSNPYYPRFIWMPAGNDPQAAVSIWRKFDSLPNFIDQQLTKLAGTNVQISAVEISPATEVALDRVLPEPLWVTKAREQLNKGDSTLSLLAIQTHR